MHAQRFGRAVGGGVRGLLRAAVLAVDAANTPSPRTARAGRPIEVEPPVRAARRTPTRAGGLRGGANGLARAGQPLWRIGGVLWLEVTGTLFGLIGLLAAGSVWAGRAHLRQGPGQAHEWAGVAMAAVFLWFALSNFVRAARRSRQR